MQSDDAPPSKPLTPRVELHAADGTRLVLLSDSSLVVGKASAPSFRMGGNAVQREHLRFGFHEGTLAVSAHAPGCSISRAGAGGVFVSLSHVGNVILTLAGGDTVFLRPGLGLIVNFVFAPAALPHPLTLPPPPSYPELAMQSAATERDNARLRVEVARLPSRRKVRIPGTSWTPNRNRYQKSATAVRGATDVPPYCRL